MYEIFGKLAILPDGVKNNVSLAVEGDCIADVGPTHELRKRYRFSDSIGSEDAIICPGFVNTHMHSFQIATRGLTSDKSLLNWLKRNIWRWEGSITREQARACARLAYLEMLKSGITAFVDYTSVRYADEAFKAAKEFGLRGCIGKTMMDRNSPPELLEDTDESLKETESLIRRWHGSESGRIRYSITPRFGIACTDELLLGCKELMDRYGKKGVIFTTHAQESSSEVASDRKNYGSTAIAHFHKLGLLGKNTLLAHCVWLTPQDMRLLAKTGTRVAHCPGSNMMLASGCAPIGRMLCAGIKVSIGTDMGAYYNTSMFEQMRLSVLLQKVSRLNPNAFDHKHAFKMATEWGSRALGLETGRLECGKKADIIILSGKYLGFIPDNNTVAQIVYAGAPDAVETVICDGRILMAKCKVLVADEQKIREEATSLLGSKSWLDKRKNTP